MIPTISVIIPIFNKKGYIAECLDSIVSQTLHDIEIICIDDGSTDGSSDIVKEYITKHDNIILISQDNSGVGASRNLGISRATGEYICFVDPDDYIPSKTIYEKLYDRAKKGNYQIVGGSFSSLKNGEIVTKYTGLFEKYVIKQEGAIKYSDYQFDYGFQRFIYKREMILLNNVTFPNYLRFQDPPFFVKAMSSADQIYVIKDVTYRYREAYKQISWNVSKKNDNLLGMIDCLTIAASNGYKELASTLYKRLTSAYYKEIMLRNSNRFEAVTVMKRMDTIRQILHGMKLPHDELGREIDYLKKIIHPSTTPSISVIVPVYKVEPYIRECLDSIINQTFTDFEIICVDDGTPDLSADICEQYSKDDSRVRVIHRFNGGLSNARNTGADFANGDILFFVDSDDILPPNSLELIVHNMKKENLDFLVFESDTLIETEDLSSRERKQFQQYCNRTDTTPVMTGLELLEIMLNEGAYRSPVQFTAIRRMSYIEHRIHCYPNILHEDNLYTVEALLSLQRTMYLSEILYIRRVRPESIMTSKKSFNNFYGYFKCYTEMMKLCIATSDPKKQKLLEKMIIRNKKSGDTVFKYLEPAERIKMQSMRSQERLMLAFEPGEDLLWFLGNHYSVDVNSNNDCEKLITSMIPIANTSNDEPPDAEGCPNTYKLCSINIDGNVTRYEILSSILDAMDSYEYNSTSTFGKSTIQIQFNESIEDPMQDIPPSQFDGKLIKRLMRRIRKRV